MTRVGINAANGRMGQQLLYAASRDRDTQLAVALLRENHQWNGQTVAQQFPHIKTDIRFSDQFAEQADQMDVLIDFSLPDYSLATAKRAAEMKIPLVIGTTGFSYQQKEALAELGSHIPLLMAPNMSVGVNVSLKLIEMVAKALGNEADIEIIEAHHRFKKDAPSGTALRMGEAAASGLGRPLSELAAFDRCNQDAIRKPGSIGFSAIRGGNIVGDHTVMFAMAGEEIEITHKARDRQTFAQGAIKAARWLSSQGPGNYDMQDVLGLK